MQNELAIEAQLKKLEDLSLRQITSIGFYPLIYIVCFFPVFFGEHSRQCILRVIWMGFFLLLAVTLRFYSLKHLRRAGKKTEFEVPNTLSYITLVLCALCWGLIISYAQVDDELFEHFYALLAGTLALIGGGVLASCIDKKAMTLFVSSIGVPPIVTVYFTESNAPSELGLIIAFYCAGMIWLASLPRREYDNLVMSNLELKRVLADQYRRNSIDWLTKVKNRSYFESALRCELERSVELKIPLSILVVDIDHFKNVNDTYGHLFGDFTLLTTAQRIENSIKHASDLVARYGGEEFCILLPGVGRDEAFNVAERLRKDIENNSISRGNIRMKVTISVGGYTFIAEQVLSAQEIFNFADEALYRAKENGRNQTLWSD